MIDTFDKQLHPQPASSDADTGLDGLQTLWNRRTDRLAALLAAPRGLAHPAHDIPVRWQSRSVFIPNAIAACFLLGAIVVSTSGAQAAPYRLHGDQTYAESVHLVQEALLQ